MSILVKFKYFENDKFVNSACGKYDPDDMTFDGFPELLIIENSDDIVLKEDTIIIHNKNKIYHITMIPDKDILDLFKTKIEDEQEDNIEIESIDDGESECDDDDY